MYTPQTLCIYSLLNNHCITQYTHQYRDEAKNVRRTRLASVSLRSVNPPLCLPIRVERSAYMYIYIYIHLMHTYLRKKQRQQILYRVYRGSHAICRFVRSLTCWKQVVTWRYSDSSAGRMRSIYFIWIMQISSLTAGHIDFFASDALRELYEYKSCVFRYWKSLLLSSSIFLFV